MNKLEKLFLFLEFFLNGMDTMFETVETVDFPKKDTEVANYGVDDSSIVGTVETIEQVLVLTDPDLHWNWVFEILQGHQNVVVLEADF